MKRIPISILSTVSTSADSLFGWLHLPILGSGFPTPQDCVTIICPPFGYEYTHSHRSLRYLADSLARQGLPCIRFDYHGTGDSPGSELDSDRISRWKDDVISLIEYAKKTTGCSKVCLVGVRLGATLATLAASEVPVDFLIQWNPVIQGKRYVRELQALAASAYSTQLSDRTENVLESAGFPMSFETLEHLKRLSLLDIQLKKPTSILVIDRDDMEPSLLLVETLQKKGHEVQSQAMSGYAEMMAEPQYTQVPVKTLALISTWLLDRSESIENPAQNKLYQGSVPPFVGTEQPHVFGEQKNLFGLLSYKDKPNFSKPVVVLLNSGTDHHVGANRLYVHLARKIAGVGLDVLRMDLRGVGDSAGLAEGVKMRENHPYPDTTTQDVEQTLSYLSHLGYQKFILMGLCSGAYAAFHAAVRVWDHKILEAVLINPLVFHWHEGISLDTPKHFQNVVYYRNAAKNARNWIKFLMGRVRFKIIFSLVLQQSKRLIKEVMTSTRSTQLTHDIHKVLSEGRKISLWIACGDPGYDILKAGAKEITRRSLRNKKMRLAFIPGGDHTFTLLKPRLDLIERLAKDLEVRFGSKV